MDETRSLANPGEQITILMPVFNDWTALDLLLAQVDQVLLAHDLAAQILIVDDGSTVGAARVSRHYQAIRLVEILHLRRNLGHQRAIAIGLAFIEAERPDQLAVVVMDSDGEDDSADIPRLLSQCRLVEWQAMVFAERTKRSESLRFRVCYHLYRWGHRVLTGRSVRVGNFSVIPRSRLVSLVAASELWNHYAAAAFTTRQPIVTIPTTRAHRLDGLSRMNFINLVIHGLSAISVYSDIIGVRLIIATVLMMGLDGLALVGTVLIRLFTDRAIPGWATTVFGVLLILLVQATLFLFVFCFMILANRNSASFLPMRDYGYFIGARREVFHQ